MRKGVHLRVKSAAKVRRPAYERQRKGRNRAPDEREVARNTLRAICGASSSTQAKIQIYVHTQHTCGDDAADAGITRRDEAEGISSARARES